MHDFTRAASQRRKGLLRSRTVTFCVLLTATSPAWAGDTHFTAMTDTIMNMNPYGGFDGVNPANGPDSRLIYDRAGTAQSIAATARSASLCSLRHIPAVASSRMPNPCSRV